MSMHTSPKTAANAQSSSGQRLPAYVLITPARNEAKYIELTLKSMVEQTFRPLAWVVVSDGSTDGTDELVSAYASKHEWIRLLRMPERVERHFAGKVHAFNAGLDLIKDLGFAIVGNLDADVSFGPNHFEYLIRSMAENPQLGVAGAPFQEGDFRYDFRYSNIENVWGGCQLFRRECFDAIGGYRPLKGGCIDHVAVVSARAAGWQSRTFTGSVCVHHRQMGTALQGAVKAKFRLGQKDYSIGNHPLWQLSRSLYQMTHRPYLFGGLAVGAGFLWSALRFTKRGVPPEVVAFIRHEQMGRLKRFVLGRVLGQASATR